MTHEKLSAFLFGSESEPEDFREASRRLLALKKLYSCKDFQFSLESLVVIRKIKLFQNSLASIMLNGETCENNGLLGQTMLLVDDKREEKVHVGRVKLLLFLLLLLILLPI